MQQQSYIVYHVVYGHAKIKQLTQSPTLVNHIGESGVINRISIRLVRLAASGLDLIGVQNAAHVNGRTCEADEAIIEQTDVLGQTLWRVAIGVNGDKHHLHVITLLSQRTHHPREVCQRGRAHVGARGVAEEQQQHLAALCIQRK
jgi:hypothetical protein